MITCQAAVHGTKATGVGTVMMGLGRGRSSVSAVMHHGRHVHGVIVMRAHVLCGCGCHEEEAAQQEHQCQYTRDRAGPMA